jgi:hypothetical protein
MLCPGAGCKANRTKVSATLASEVHSHLNRELAGALGT